MLPRVKSLTPKIEQTPLVSIIIPIRNEGAFIERGLSAIFSQDYPAKQIEILIADGMSTDETLDIIKKLAGQNSNFNIQILDNPKKIVPTGMNIALRQAKGEIIIRVDGHCIIAPDYLSLCVSYLLSRAADGVGGSMQTIGENFISESIAIAMSSKFGVGNSSFRTESGTTKFVDSVPFPAYTRQIVDLAGFYDEELIRNQDDEYNYRIREIGGKIFLASDIHSKYYSRGSLAQLARQYFQYGFWKVRVLQKHPRQMSLRQFVPPAFALGLGASLILSTMLDWGINIFAFILGSYLFANLAASFITAAQRGWKYFLLLPITFSILHFGYGFGFLFGLFKFWNRWGDKVGKTPPN
jgi:glycosyltransferase involved in cell wall biosynthesis